MKILKSINWIVGLGIFLIAACAPIEDRDVLTNTYSVDDIKLVAEQTFPGSNVFTLKMTTPGVTGYWDYVIDKATSNEVKVVFPLAGKQTFTYVVSSPYIKDGDVSKREFITKTIDVDITAFDPSEPLPDEWEYLTGDGSKTWVFDTSNPDRWWYMTDEWTEAMMKEGKEPSFWWQPSFGEAPSDFNGEITFSRVGSLKFFYKASPSSAEIGNTAWVVNNDWTQIELVGDANILGVEGGGEHVDGLKNYHIMELTNDRLVLYNGPVVWSPGWVWVFKVKD